MPRIHRLAITSLAAATTLCAGSVQAEIEYEIHVGYTSEYIFRGIDLGNNLTEVGLDASTEWNGFGFSAGVWATAFESPATTNQIDSETDFYGEISKDLGFMTAAVGYIYYWNLGRLGADTQEVYFKASRDFGFAEASLTYFWDVDLGNDGYTEFALSRGFELSPCLALNLSSNIGYLVEQSDFTAWTNRVSLDWTFVENATLSPFVALSIALSDEPNTAYSGSENEFVAGSLLSVTF